MYYVESHFGALLTKNCNMIILNTQIKLLWAVNQTVISHLLFSFWSGSELMLQSGVGIFGDEGGNSEFAPNIWGRKNYQVT